MMLPSEFEVLIDRHREDYDLHEVRAVVALNAREHLATIAPGLMTTTDNLIEALYPRKLAEQSLRGDRTRFALSKLLLDCAKKELSDCCVKGEVNGQYMGKPKRPWLWFYAPPPETCPHCGQPMPVEVA